MIYLNQAGTSWPKPEAVARAVEGAHAEPPDSWDASIARDHARVAAVLGVRDASRLLISPGCTSALHVAIADHPWEPGDCIVTSELEHHAVVRPAQLLSARGVEHVAIRRTLEEPFDLDAFAHTLRTHSVRLVAVTAACNVTGELLPLREIVDLAHEHGSACLIDAAQTAGWMAIDVEELGADLLALAGHKGPHGPRGVGALYIAPGVEMNPPGATCDTREGEACAAIPDYCDLGSIDRPALAGLAEGFEWISSRAPSALAHARSLAERLRTRLHETGAFTIHGSGSPVTRMPTLAITHAVRSPAELARALREKGIIASPGLQCAPLAHGSIGTGDGGVVRISFGPQSSIDHVDESVEVLAAATR